MPAVLPVTFQSAPDPKAGGNADTGEGKWNGEEFQSAPDPKAGGNCRRWQVPGAGCPFQSAPDPKAGGNMAIAWGMKPPESFNPPPTRRPEETGWLVRNGKASKVSIRPRPEGRRKPTGRPACSSSGSFQSAPDPKAGGNNSSNGRTFAGEEFQSAPDPKAGGNFINVNGAAETDSFQSAPDPKAGGNHVSGCSWYPHTSFQSAPDPKAGGNPPCVRLSAFLSSFNPPPTRRPEETSLICSAALPSRSFNPPPTRRPEETGKR